MYKYIQFLPVICKHMCDQYTCMGCIWPHQGLSACCMVAMTGTLFHACPACMVVWDVITMCVAIYFCCWIFMLLEYGAFCTGCVLVELCRCSILLVLCRWCRCECLIIPWLLHNSRTVKTSMSKASSMSSSTGIRCERVG